MELHIPELTMLLSEMQSMKLQMTRMEALLFEKEGKPFLTIQEVATELNFSEASVKAWCSKGRRHPQTRRVVVLKSYKSPGGHYRIKRKDLEVFKELFSTK